MYDELLLTIRGGVARQTSRVSLAQLEKQERADLKAWITANPIIIGDDVEVIASECRHCVESSEELASSSRILGLGRDGRPVVVIVEREEAPESVHMQALSCAVWIGSLTQIDLAELIRTRPSGEGVAIPDESALTRLVTDFNLTSETIRRPKVVIVAADFLSTTKSSVEWLNEHDMNISLIRLRTYRPPDGQIVISVNRILPD